MHWCGASIGKNLPRSPHDTSHQSPPARLDRLEGEIAASDEEIDNLVYDLYGVMDEERKLIEEG